MTQQAPRPCRTAAFCIAAAMLMTACTEPPSHGEVGQPAPAFSAIAMAGDSVHLERLSGQVVLLNLWATWCIPCRVEIPELQALHQEFGGRGLRVLGASVDEGGADADVADFAKHFGITYTILRDPDERISTLFAIPGVPASFLIDRKGIVRWRHLGPFRANDTAFRNALNAAL
jgi:peroxiredoxin